MNKKNFCRLLMMKKGGELGANLDSSHAWPLRETTDNTAFTALPMNVVSKPEVTRLHEEVDIPPVEEM
jgi:hypothetical protein